MCVNYIFSVECFFALKIRTRYCCFLSRFARQIVSTAPEGSELSKIILRLGGFHLLMSFFGAISFIMQGSGLKEVLSLIYAPNSLDKMLNGHAYARAVRAHTLLHLALATIILKEMIENDYML